MPSIRLARPEDAPQLRLLNDRFNGQGSNTERAIESSLRGNALELVCVAEEDGALLGFCCGQIFASLCYGERYAEVTELFVDEPHRRRGIAGRLMAFMEDTFAARGVHHYQLFTGADNEGAQAFYRGMGYAESAERMFRKRPAAPSRQRRGVTTIYMIRHAEPDHGVRDDFIRPLTGRGLADADRLPASLAGVHLAGVYSSPYLRAVQTVWPLANARGLDCVLVDGLRERGVGAWVEDFRAFAQRQWEDFSYKLPGGECLAEVQARNIGALERILAERRGETVAIGTHGTALGCILRYYDPSFGFEDFWRIAPMLPYVICLEFDGDACVATREMTL